LSFGMNFTTVLLVFVLFTGVVWIVHKKSLDNLAHADRNHFTDYMSGFFPIILVVFVLRTFIAHVPLPHCRGPRPG